MHSGELTVLIEHDGYSAQNLKYMALETKCFSVQPYHCP